MKLPAARRALGQSAGCTSVLKPCAGRDLSKTQCSSAAAHRHCHRAAGTWGTTLVGLGVGKRRPVARPARGGGSRSRRFSNRIQRHSYKTPGVDVFDARRVWLSHRNLAASNGFIVHGMRQDHSGWPEQCQMAFRGAESACSRPIKRGRPACATTVRRCAACATRRFARAEVDAARKRPGSVMVEAAGAGLARRSSQTGTNHGERGRFRLNRVARIDTIVA